MVEFGRQTQATTSPASFVERKACALSLAHSDSRRMPYRMRVCRVCAKSYRHPCGAGRELPRDLFDAHYERVPRGHRDSHLRGRQEIPGLCEIPVPGLPEKRLKYGDCRPALLSVQQRSSLGDDGGRRRQHVRPFDRAVLASSFQRSLRVLHAGREWPRHAACKRLESAWAFDVGRSRHLPKRQMEDQ